MNLYVYILIVVVVPLLAIIFKSYFEEKGRIMAQRRFKERMIETEERIKTRYKKEYDAFSDQRHYVTERYMNLYSHLYSIVSQSEYLRYLLRKDGHLHNPTDVPLISVGKSTRVEYPLLGITERVDETDDITEFDGKQIFNSVLESREYASPALLSLAVSYRYISNKLVSGTTIANGRDMMAEFKQEELKIVRKIVRLIIYEFNWLRKQLGLTYAEKELNDKVFDLSIFECDDFTPTDGETQM